MKICGIYCIENLVNNKRYYGQSVHVNNRIATHKLRLKKGIHKNTHLQDSWNLHGESNFIFYLVRTCQEDELDYYEIYYIQKDKTNHKKYGYNLDSGGNENKHRSIETRKKMSKIMKGRVFSDVSKKRMSDAHKGKKMHENTRKSLLYAISHPSDDARKKMSDKAKGRRWTDERKENLSKSKKGKNKTFEHRLSLSRKEFPGTRKSKNGKKWVARVVVNGKEMHLGTYEYQEDAALAYKNYIEKIRTE